MSQVIELIINQPNNKFILSVDVDLCIYNLPSAVLVGWIKFSYCTTPRELFPTTLVLMMSPIWFWTEVVVVVGESRLIVEEFASIISSWSLCSSTIGIGCDVIKDWMPPPEDAGWMLQSLRMMSPLVGLYKTTSPAEQWIQNLEIRNEQSIFLIWLIDETS